MGTHTNPIPSTGNNNVAAGESVGNGVGNGDVEADGKQVATATATATATKKKKKKKKKNNGQVPAPTPEVLNWAQNLSVGKCRRHIAVGMRVKVRFATKVKNRDGKYIKRKIWYGGRATAISAKRSKIRIKYDDGTSEISKFPDTDIVIDADHNGTHAVPGAETFCPPASPSSSSTNNEAAEDMDR